MVFLLYLVDVGWDEMSLLRFAASFSRVDMKNGGAKKEGLVWMCIHFRVNIPRLSVLFEFVFITSDNQDLANWSYLSSILHLHQSTAPSSFRLADVALNQRNCVVNALFAWLNVLSDFMMHVIML